MPPRPHTKAAIMGLHHLLAVISPADFYVELLAPDHDTVVSPRIDAVRQVKGNCTRELLQHADFQAVPPVSIFGRVDLAVRTFIHLPFCVV